MKVLLAGAAATAWIGAVPAFASLAVLAGPGPGTSASGMAVTAVSGPVSAGTAIRIAVSMVGITAGWHRLCDRLVCRAYGHANSGYPDAAAHWAAMFAAGHAHPGDRCPPAGAFVFWRSAAPEGHVALVTSSDVFCDPARIAVVSNDVLDTALGHRGGVYHVTLARIEDGFVTPGGYLGWSDPVCAGRPLLPDPEPDSDQALLSDPAHNRRTVR